MSDENKTPAEEQIPETAEKEAVPAEEQIPEAAAQEAVPAEEQIPETAEKEAVPAAEDKTLNDELEQLRDTFQSEYDKAAAEAEAAGQPEIQALEDAPDEDDGDGDDAEDETDDPGAPAADGKKEKKKMSGKVKALIAVLVCVCVLIVAPLATYFALSIKFPNFNTFFSAYARGAFAKDAAERISCYTEALDSIGTDERLAGIKQELYEEIAVATCERDGYSAAMTYAKNYLSQEQLSAPKTKEFKELMKVKDEIEGISAGVWDAAAEALGDGTDPEAPDYEAAAEKLGASAPIRASVAKALKYVASGMAKEKTAESKADYEEAIRDYLSAHNELTGMGAKALPLLQTLAVKLFDRGYAYETKLLLDQRFTSEDLHADDNEAFTAMQNELYAMTGLQIDLCAVAEAGAEQADLSEETLLNALPAETASLSDRAKKSLALIAQTIAEGMNSEGAANLTKAQLHYATALSAAETLEMPTYGVAKRAFSVAFRLGDLQSAKELADGYLGEGTPAAGDAELTQLMPTVLALYDAQNAANEAFYPFYSNAMYSGGEMNKDEINAALDALATPDASAAQKAYVSFYKYLAEAFTTQDFAVMEKYLDEFAAAMQAYPMLYGYSKVQLYMAQQKFDEAAALVKDLLQINTADDLGNSVLAMNARRNGDVEDSLSIAQTGMELSGAEVNCAHQAVIDLLLLKRYDEAFELAERMFHADLTADNCEMLKILAATYDGDDAELKSAMDEAAAKVDETYAQYGVSLSENAQAIVDGTKTPEDVFTAGTFDLK